MPYAFDEFYSLLSQLDGPQGRDIDVERYIGALMAELAYYHVPQWEIDAAKRAKILSPCDAYEYLLQKGVATDIVGYLNKRDLKAFVVEWIGVLAVGIRANNKLFIGFRGTLFRFEWRTNLKCLRVKWDGVGSFHRGFLAESAVISHMIMQQMHSLGMAAVDEVFLSGHSLGGAVAAISEYFLAHDDYNITTNLYASPRYCNAGAYAAATRPAPAQIRRRNDAVPSLPPKIFGYKDHPRQYGTNGREYAQAAENSDGFREAHKIEKYREELGHTCNAAYAGEHFSDMDKLIEENLSR